MNKIILLIIFLCTVLNAKIINAKYDISYGIFGKLGIAETSLEVYDNKYKIKVHAYATGFAKFLSSGKEEFYISEGIIKEDSFIPLKYYVKKQNTYKIREKTYIFNHNKKNISLKKFTKKLVTKHNNKLETFQEWEETKSLEKNKFFAQNDLLSLFFNIKKVVSDFSKGNSYKLKAIGANKTDGKLNISIPEGKKYKMLEESLGKNNIKFIVTINQDIFSSTNGELLISLNKEGFCNNAILKDVLLFGDIRGEMKEFNIK